MKQLSKDEMKQVIGGLVVPPDCPISCQSAKECKQVNRGDTCSDCTDSHGTFKVCSWGS